MPLMISKKNSVHLQISVTLGQENINTQVYTQLDATHCHIMTEYLQRYTLIGEPALLGRAVKILRLAAFAPALPPSMDYNIRVYVVEDTPDALEVWNLFLCLVMRKPNFCICENKYTDRGNREADPRLCFR